MEKTQKELTQVLKSTIKEMAELQKPRKKELKEQFKLYMKTIEDDRRLFPWGKEFKEKVGFDYNPIEEGQQNKLSIRCYLLAYGFLRGIPYRAMENKTREEPGGDWFKKGRARRVHVIYSKHYAKDSRIPFVTQEDIERAFCGDDNGS